jgi:hypothetical protein
MSFDTMCQSMAAAHFRSFGKVARYFPPSGDPIDTQAIFDEEYRDARDPRDLTAGRLGQVVDRRPNVELPKEVVGQNRGGKVLIGERIWALDAPISDDGYSVRFFVK